MVHKTIADHYCVRNDGQIAESWLFTSQNHGLDFVARIRFSFSLFFVTVREEEASQSLQASICVVGIIVP
jgi:hypothetical protein